MGMKVSLNSNELSHLLSTNSRFLSTYWAKKRGPLWENIFLAATIFYLPDK